jgi:hypothetical protein
MISICPSFSNISSINIPPPGEIPWWIGGDLVQSDGRFLPDRCRQVQRHDGRIGWEYSLSSHSGSPSAVSLIPAIRHFLLGQPAVQG